MPRAKSHTAYFVKYKRMPIPMSVEQTSVTLDKWRDIMNLGNMKPEIIGRKKTLKEQLKAQTELTRIYEERLDTAQKEVLRLKAILDIIVDMAGSNLR